MSPLNTNDGFYLSHIGSDVGQIFPTASLHRDHSILYALVCEKMLSHIPVTAHEKDKKEQLHVDRQVTAV